MERKSGILSFVLFVTLLCVYLTVHAVVASKVSTEKALSNKTAHFTKTMARRTVYDTSGRRGRSIQEQGGIEPLPTDVCADIIGPNWSKKRQAKSPCPTLVVWVPKKIGFTEFVKVNENAEVEGGFSLAIFCYSLQLLPYNVQPIFKPFVNDKGESNGTYDQLLKHIKGKTCEAVAGDVTIRGNRAQYVSFTIPYLSSEVYMLVRAAHEWNQNLLTFTRPFTKRLWLALLGACFLIGFTLSFLEFRKHNPEFAIPSYKQLVMVIWFPISTIFFHEGRIRNNCSKVVLVMWLCSIFIVMQIFTAMLSTWLTLDQLRPRLPSTFENVGYQDGSFLKELILEQYNCSEKNLLALNTMEDYKHVLSNGSVNVIFDELPYIELFLSKYGSGSEYMKFGPLNQESGIGFIFTAMLSTWLTLDQLRPRLPSTFENVGYQDGSFLKELILEQYNCSEKNLLALNTMEDYKHVLSNGSVNVIFDELPYIELFLSKYGSGSEYMKFGPLNQESGIGFAFPLKSPLIEMFSRAVINVTESKNMIEMKRKYLGFPNLETSEPNQALPQSLDIESFLGLFIFMGTVIVGAIIASEITLMRRRSRFGVGEEMQEQQDTISVKDFLIFMEVAAIILSDTSRRRRNNVEDVD